MTPYCSPQHRVAKIDAASLNTQPQTLQSILLASLLQG